MNCLLCLEEFKDPLSLISIYNNVSEANQSTIACIIEFHFWLKPDENVYNNICTECWKHVCSFHEFYERIKSCHNLLQQTEIKEENGEEIECMIKEKSARRGRPPGRKTTKRIQKDQIVKEKTKKCKIEKTIELPATTTRSLRSCAIKEEVPQEKGEFVDVANETLLVEMPVKVELENMNNEEENQQNITKDPFDMLSMQTNTTINTEEIATSISTKKEKRKKKHMKKPVKNEDFQKKVEKSRKHDDFIKTHFRLKCTLCDLPLENFDKLKIHFRKEHQKRGYASCCSRKFDKRGLLADHIHVHLDANYFACQQCGKVLCDRYSLDNHTKIKHGGQRERRFQCEVCAKGFFSRAIYQRHLLQHVPEEEKTFICQKCQKPFASQSLLNDHMNIVHLLIHANICDQCGKLVRGGPGALQRHQEEHNGVPRAPIVCQICGLTVTTKYGLVRHMKRQHSEENRQPRQCPFCNKISPSTSAHQYHIKYMHQLERKHACTMCDKAFKRPRDLREHMTIHTGEVLYTCPHCPKPFNSQANMHSHRKKVHRKEWEETRMQKYALNTAESAISTNE